MKKYSHIDWTLLKKFRLTQTNPKTGAPFNQQEIADLIGKKQSYISRLEKGDFMNPDDTVIEALAAAFALKPSHFLGYIEKRDRETNFPESVKITYSAEPLPIPKYTQIYNAKGMDYADAILVDNPDHVDRPPFLKNVVGAYAVVMPSHEMEPRYRQGDTLYVNPEILPDRFDDVVIHLKFKHHKVCIIREAVCIENAAADGDQEIPSYGVLSLTTKEAILLDISRANSEEIIKDGGTMFNTYPLMASEAEWFTLADVTEESSQTEQGIWKNPIGKPVAIDIHPIVGMQRHRLQTNREQVHLKANSILAARPEVGQATVVTSGKPEVGSPKLTVKDS